MIEVPRSASPHDVDVATEELQHHGDAADQAERLSMIMEAEAVQAALRGEAGDGSADGYAFPLEDVEDLVAAEDADDASDDPMHAGGFDSQPILSAEQAAMHVVDADHPYLDERDEDEDVRSGLTPEDETLLGIDPYED